MKTPVRGELLSNYEPLRERKLLQWVKEKGNLLNPGIGVEDS
jgi:hypothetical protein